MFSEVGKLEEHGEAGTEMRKDLFSSSNLPLVL